MIVCSCFRVSWFHLRAFSWLPAVIMQNVTTFIQKVALHSRIHDRNFRFFQVFPTRPEGACCFWKLLGLQPVLKPLAKLESKNYSS